MTPDQMDEAAAECERKAKENPRDGWAALHYTNAANWRAQAARARSQ